MNELSENELKMRTEIFQQDLKNLFELTITNGPIQIRHVRQASVIVRRWLCDNELSQITRALNITAKVPALADRNIFLSVQEDKDVRYYLSSGISFDGQAVNGIYHSESDKIPSWFPDFLDVDFEDVSLGKILAKPVLYFDGETFNMGEVLRFACNKLGGAHFDSSRNDRQQKIEDASNYLTIGGPENKLGTTAPSEIHMPLELDSDEWLNGVFVVVIAASAMLLNILFNEEAFLEFETTS